MNIEGLDRVLYHHTQLWCYSKRMNCSASSGWVAHTTGHDRLAALEQHVHLRCDARAAIREILAILSSDAARTV